MMIWFQEMTLIFIFEKNLSLFSFSNSSLEFCHNKLFQKIVDFSKISILIQYCVWKHDDLSLREKEEKRRRNSCYWIKLPSFSFCFSKISPISSSSSIHTHARSHTHTSFWSADDRFLLPMISSQLCSWFWRHSTLRRWTSSYWHSSQQLLL